MSDAGGTKGFTITTRAFVSSTINNITLAILQVCIVAIVASAAPACLALILPIHFRFPFVH